MKPVRSAGTATLQGHGEKILIVEDEDAVRRLAERILSKNGYKVAVAASAEEAQEIIDRSQEEFNLVFSDMVLPGENGIALTERLSARHPDLRILLTSGYSDIEGLKEVVEKGYPFIGKPYSLSQILQKLAELLRDGGGRE